MSFEMTINNYLVMDIVRVIMDNLHLIMDLLNKVEDIKQDSNLAIIIIIMVNNLILEHQVPNIFY